MHTRRGIACTVPVRLSFGNGGDTDYYLQEIGWGCVLNATLKSLYYKCHLIPGDKTVLHYNDYFAKTKDSFPILQYTLTGVHLDLFKATLAHVHPEYSGEIHIDTNVPPRSGLGGSSSLMVALIASLRKLKNENLHPEAIASTAYLIERNIMNIKGGYQDQWAASYGTGFNLFTFKIGKVAVEPLKLEEKTLQRLENHLCLFSVSPRKISSGKVHELQEKKAKEDKALVMDIMVKKRNNTIQMAEALKAGDLHSFGKCLNTEWELKKAVTPGIVDDDLEKIYGLAKQHGALGGKVTGSGGCSFFYCKDPDQVKSALEKEGATFFQVVFQRPEEPGIQLI